MARQQGLTEDIADQIDDGYEASQLDDRQKAALRWTDAVLDNPVASRPTCGPASERYLTPAELLELTMALALFHGLSRVLISLGLEPEEMETTIVATRGTAATAATRQAPEARAVTRPASPTGSDERHCGRSVHTTSPTRQGALAVDRHRRPPGAVRPRS